MGTRCWNGDWVVNRDFGDWGAARVFFPSWNIKTKESLTAFWKPFSPRVGPGCWESKKHVSYIHMHWEGIFCQWRKWLSGRSLIGSAARASFLISRQIKSLAYSRDMMLILIPQPTGKGSKS